MSPDSEAEADGGAPAEAPLPSESSAPAAPPDGSPLRLVSVDPPDGSLVQTHVALRLEFDHPLDPRTLRGALAFAYTDPGVTFLADPFRHVGLSLDGGGRALVAAPPELLVGRAFTVGISSGLRGLDGAEPAAEMPRELHYRVMELPP